LKKTLPIGTSLVALDILLAVAAIGLRKERTTVKGLFAALPHSVMGIRQNFDRLIADGWIELRPVPYDARLKYVRPSRKLKAATEQLQQRAQKHIENYVQNS